MATTTNFGWETPDDTDLVKDGAAAIRTALSGVDTSFVDLKGGTTGQVLAKASGTDLDFVWSADAAGMTNPMTTTGDTIYSSSGSTPARLGIGSTGNVLTVSGGVPTWAAPTSASSNFTVLNSGGTTLSGSSTSITGISGKSNLRILVDNAQLSSSYTWLYFTINNDTTDANYLTVGSYIYPGASYSAGIFQIFDSFLGHPGIPFGKSTSSGTPYLSGGATISGGNSSGYKVVQTNGASAAASGNANAGVATQSYYTGSSTISSIQIRVSGGTMSGGTVYILGSDN